MQTFTAQLSHLSSDAPHAGERSATLRFLASSSREAALGVWDWWLNRHWALPGVFTELLCVKLWYLDLQQISDTGHLPPSLGAQVIEWKCDTAGMLYPDYADCMLSDS